MMKIPAGYKVEKTHQPVQGGPDFVTRWKWRADRRCKKLNKTKFAPSYRYEVRPRIGGGWEVQAMQNILVPLNKR